MEEKKKKRIIFVTQNIAEPMWSGFVVVNIIDNRALTNEINKRFELSLENNTSKLKAEIRGETETESCHTIYSVSVTNLSEFYKFADKDELPEGVNLRIIRYELW